MPRSRAFPGWTRPLVGLSGNWAALLVAALPLIALPSAAKAQLALGATLSTNEIFRGQTISGDDPTASLSLSFDHSDGFFAGAGASVAIDDKGPHWTAATQYGGYALRRGRTSFELGLVHRQYRRVSDLEFRDSYVEGFVGVTHRGASFRLFVSPNYAHRGIVTYYGELNAPLFRVAQWTLNGHFGASLVPRHSLQSRELRLRPDWKLEASRPIGRFFVGAGVAGTSYPVIARSGDPRIFAVISRAF